MSRRPTAFLLVLIVLVNGCGRAFYRKQADLDAYALLEQRRCDPQWPQYDYSIDIDPASRMHDPFDPDCPPMPPDDPAAHCFMDCVDSKRGAATWDARGFAGQVENTTWRDLLPISENGRVRINAETAVQLALLHSPVYQQQLENLYLSALDVSFERFRFDTQFFGGSSGFLTVEGRDRSGTGESSTTFDLSTFSQAGGNSLQARRLFATGAELVVGFANSLIWEVSGPGTHTATSLIDFTLIQPLLRGGGRDIALERLTFSERNLLANVRQMERFRRGFYLEVITGRNAGVGPVQRGFNGVSVGILGAAGNAAVPAGGYLGLLRSQQDIRNQRANVASLESSVALLEAFFLAGRIDYFQVEFSRQALFNAQSRLLNLERAFQAALDQFKITLGLPPYIDIELDEELIKPFQLVDPTIVPLQNQLTKLQQDVGRRLLEVLMQVRVPQPANDDRGELVPPPSVRQANQANQEIAAAAAAANGDADSSDPAGNPPGFELATPALQWTPDIASSLQQLRRDLALAKQAIDRSVTVHMVRARRDIGTLRSALPDRLQMMQRLTAQVQKSDSSSQQDSWQSREDTKPLSAMLPFDPARLRELPLVLEQTLDDISLQFGKLEQQIDELAGLIAALIEDGAELTPKDLAARLGQEVLVSIPAQFTELSANVLSLTLVQARARMESVNLVPVDIDWRMAFETARSNRLDWMNARANVVDAWRVINFAANDLESQLDIVLSGDVANLGDNPLDFRESTGRIRAGLQFDAPLTRLQERNTYRQSLIEYQRTRRSFYQFKDAIAAGLRDEVRRLNINQIDFELNRAGVDVAIAQVELARLRLQEPPRPGEQSNFGATTARDLVSALADLLNVQDSFLAIWTNHESLRRSLDFDMGTMQLDNCGYWADPGALSNDMIEDSSRGSEGLDPEEIDDYNRVEEIPTPEPDADDVIRPVEEVPPELPANVPPTQPAAELPNELPPATPSPILQEFQRLPL